MSRTHFMLLLFQLFDSFVKCVRSSDIDKGLSVLNFPQSSVILRFYFGLNLKYASVLHVPLSTIFFFGLIIINVIRL